MASSSYDAAKDADAVAIVTEWDAFRALDLKKLAQVMKGNVLVDLRNIYNPSEVAQTSLKYTSVGRVR
jgi:UDPglucose 6-dehydrogenase